MLDSVDDAACKGACKDHASDRFTDSTRPQEEERVGIELPDCRAVARTNVVRVDLELGFRVDRSPIRQQQVRVRLSGIGLLSAGLDDDPSPKDAFRLVCEYAAIFLITGAVIGDVIDRREVVDVSGCTAQGGRLSR